MFRPYLGQQSILPSVLGYRYTPESYIAGEFQSSLNQTAQSVTCHSVIPMMSNCLSPDIYRPIYRGCFVPFSPTHPQTFNLPSLYYSPAPQSACIELSISSSETPTDLSRLSHGGNTETHSLCITNSPCSDSGCNLEENKKKISNDLVKKQKAEWSIEYNKILSYVTIKYKNDWKKIAKHLSKVIGRKITPAFARKQYKALGSDGYEKGVKFSHEEDILIAKYVKEYSLDWEKIAIHFPSRNPVMLKNRYYSHIRKHRLIDQLAKLAEEQEKKLEEKNPEDVFLFLDTNLQDKLTNDIRLVEDKRPSIKLVNLENLSERYVEMNQIFLQDELHERVWDSPEIV